MTRPTPPSPTAPAQAAQTGGQGASWIDPAVVYGMVIRNVTSGGFRGAATRLDALADLGVAAIWLAPITATPDGDFGYAVTDYRDVRPEYGTLDDFRAFVDAAHARGIRVLMDVVPNHTSHLHPWSIDAAAKGAASAWADWYDRGEDGKPTYYFTWQHLPNLNFDNPAVRRYMTDALAFWMRDCGVDGYRVDVAWGIRQRRPDFWPACIAELRQIHPDALLIAEASARDPAYAASGFDAAYDWTDELGHWAWTEAFDGGGPIAPALRAALAASDPATRVFRFLNNNDTGDRFITRHGVAAYRAALAMLLTLPGLPCLFTGDEVGAEFRPYETAGEIDWSDRHGLRPFVRRLVALRREVPALHARGWELLDVAPAERVLAYRRVSSAGDALVAINLSDAAVEVALPAPGGTVDLLRGKRLTEAEAGRVALPGWGFRILGTVAS
jgi:glycosidase